MMVTGDVMSITGPVLYIAVMLTTTDLPEVSLNIITTVLLPTCNGYDWSTENTFPFTLANAP